MGNEVLQEYRKKVVILLLAIVLLSATAAAVVLPGMTVLGFYPSVKMGTIVFFIGAVIVEDIIGAYLIKRSLQYDVLPESNRIENKTEKNAVEGRFFSLETERGIVW